MNRKSDVGERAYFRSGRLIHQAGAWYLATREGEIGPFRDPALARAALQRHVMKHDAAPKDPIARDDAGDGKLQDKLQEEWHRLLQEWAIQNEFERL
jgi:hypothetical protein